MGNALLKGLVIINVIATLMLTIAGISFQNTVAKVSEKTLTTLTAENDQHTDFVRHMLGFVTNDTTNITRIIFSAALCLAINAVVFLMCIRKRRLQQVKSKPKDE